MRIHKLNDENRLKKLVEDTLAKLTGGAKSVTISTEELAHLPTPKPEAMPQVHFSTLAYEKMKALVNNCSKEIAWHGTVTKFDDLHFEVTDILVYPQTATSATVESHDDYYPQWLNNLDDDTFNTIRFQGHSHVNMHTSPSAVDTDFYETIIQHIQDYYIFFIMNKRGELWINLYNVEKNIVYETKDIVITYDAQLYTKWYEEQYALHMHSPAPIYTPTSNESMYLRAMGYPYTIDDAKTVAKKYKARGSKKYAK